MRSGAIPLWPQCGPRASERSRVSFVNPLEGPDFKGCRWWAILGSNQ